MIFLETDYEMKRQRFQTTKQDSKAVGITVDVNVDDNQPSTSGGFDLPMSTHSVVQEVNF